MPKYKIPVIYMMSGNVEIEATSIAEAINAAVKEKDTLFLPEDPQYVEDSFELLIDDSQELATINEINFRRCKYYCKGSCIGQRSQPFCTPIGCTSMIMED